MAKSASSPPSALVLWLAAVLCAPSAPVSRAQSPQKEFHETAGVSLVVVPVNVTGRDGKPVSGLTASDFQIEDEGQKRPIEALDIIDLRRKKTVPEAIASLPPAARRHFLFLFDFSYATPSEIVRSQQATMRFIGEGLDPEDLAGVATISADKGAHLILTFTSDRRQLAQAVRTLGLPNLIDRNRDPLSFAFKLPGDPFTAELATGEEYRPRTDADIAASLKIYTMLARKTADQYSTTRVVRHLGGMGALATALDEVEGRKTIIYFSEGFDGRLLVGNTTQSGERNSADNEAMLRGRFWEIDVDKRYANTPLQGQLSETLALFRRSDCVVYPIDIAGLRADGDVTLGNPATGEEALYAIASQTGGSVIRNANNLTAQLERVVEQTSLTYVLSFRPTRRLGAGKFHRLKVKVRAKGAHVSARAGYYESRTFGMMSPLERALAAADVITHEKGRSDFPMEVLGIPLAGQPLSPVPVLIEVPGEELIGRSTAERLQVGLFVYVSDEAGQLADYFTRSVGIDLARQGEALKRGRLTYYAWCRLLPGKYRIRALVQNEADGRFAFRAVPLEVPAWGHEKMWACPPLFVAGDQPGLSLRDAASRDHAEPNPLEIAGKGFVPLLHPTLTAGGESQICLILFQAGAEKGLSPFSLDATVVDRNGSERAPASITVVGRSQPSAEGLVKVLIRFRTVGLPPGAYSLRFVFRDTGAGSRLAVTQAPFRIS